MRAGDLCHRITFQKNTPTANSMNEFVDTWADYVTVWASLVPLTGNKYFMAKQANSEVKGIVRIRHRSDITATMRIKYGSRYLLIDSITNVEERNKELDIYYREALD